MDTVGKYRVLGRLGRGGMGVVYRAHDPVIGRDVALKMIVDHAVSDPAVRRRFLSEARRAGSLNHPNIVTIYDVGEHDGRPYIVMELLPGGDLRAAMDGARTMAFGDRLDVAVQVARGLACAHDNGVLHRDVKPENVFVTDGGRAKVLDFGIARVESESETVTQATVGSPRYMSPEQIRGDALDRRTDVYSFGVVLYELVGGAPPFTGRGVHTVLHKILHEPPPPLPLPDDAPGGIREVVTRCLAKDPADRYGSLHDVADALVGLQRADTPAMAAAPAETVDAAAAGPRAGGHRPPGSHRARRWPSRAILAAAVGTLAATGAVWYGASVVSDGPAAEPAAGPPAQSPPGAGDVPDGGEPVAISAAPVAGEAPVGAPPSGAGAPSDPPVPDSPAAPRPRTPARPSPPVAGDRAPPGPSTDRSPPPPPPAAGTPPPQPSRPSTGDGAGGDRAVGDGASPGTGGALPVRPRPPMPDPGPTPEDAARSEATRAARSASAALAAAMERQDPAALRGVHPFYAQMAPVFEVAGDLEADVTVSDLALSGDRATAAVTLDFSFANKTQNNRRESHSVTYEWTLTRGGGTWALTSVAPR